MNSAPPSIVHAASAHTIEGGWGESIPRVPAKLDQGKFRLQQVHVILVPLLATVLRLASSPTSALAYVVIAAWAFTGRRQAIVALFLCWQFNMTNHVFCGPPLYAAQLRFVVFFCCAFSVILHGPSRTRTTKVTGILAATVPVLMLIILHSMVFSLITDVSVLKSITFTVVFLTALCGWAWMSPAERHLAIQTIFGGLMTAIVIGLPMKFSGRGYLRGTTFLCGVFDHSQVQGPVAALVAAILTVQCLTIRPLRWWRVLLLGLSFAEIMWSGARIAVVTYGGAMAITFIVQMVGSVLYVRGENPRIVAARLGAVAVLMLVLGVVAGQQIAGGARKFLIKYGEREDSSLLEQGTSTRQHLVDMMSENVRRFPLTGIGFGVGSTPELRSNVRRDPILGIPIMATVEKGVLPLMILEEMGIPLGFLIYFWIVLLAICATRGGMLTVAVFMGTMLTNVAEASFLSPGGGGLLTILLVAWAATEPAGGAWKKHLRARDLALVRRNTAGAPLSPVFAPPLSPGLPAPPSRPLLPAPSSVIPTGS